MTIAPRSLALRLARALSAAALFAATALPIDGEVAAAVRLCKPVASSGLVTAPTEIEAKKAALDAWKAKALAHGEPYASWRLAVDKLLECLPHKNGGYECLAKGAPCTIEQAPDRRELREKRLDM
jgi:putative component of membrane protein insertase Oxa1/YidC/SpoIIIJ protein YidD